jgi:hypothetical protein
MMRADPIDPMMKRWSCIVHPSSARLTLAINDNLEAQLVCRKMFFLAVSAAVCTASFTFSLPVSKYSSVVRSWRESADKAHRGRALRSDHY